MDKGLLNEATSADDTPTPGYMLTEIARLTVANYQACIQLIEFLNARLKKNNHNVKFKCLVIIKQVCRTGRADFKKEMARNLDPVKECLQYKGPPDPLRGDEIYKRVRDAAKEALDAIFDSQMPVSSSSVTSRIQGIGGGEAQQAAHSSSSNTSSGFSFFRSESNESSYVATEGDLSAPSKMSGFGNTSSNTSGGAPPLPSSSGMTGIGNPNFKDARNEVSWTQKMAALVKDGSSTSGNNSSGNSDYQMRSNRESPYGETHKSPSYVPTTPGPWKTGSNTQQQNAPTSGGIVPDIPAIAGGLGRAGQAASDGAYEQSLVASLCEAGGMKAAPPDDQLEDFLAAAPTLSPEFIGSGLIGFINSDAWQSRAKALVVVGALVKRSGCSQHHEWWVANGAEDIQILSQTDSKATVKTQAIKTLRALGISTSSAAVTSTQPRVTHSSHASSPAPQVAAGNPSLLDFDDEFSAPRVAVPPVPVAAPAPEVSQPSAPIAAPVAQVDNLFFGLSVGTPTQGITASQSPPVNPEIPVAAPAPQSTSLFDFMDTAAPVPAAVVHPQSNPLDLNALYGPSSTTSPPPQQLPTSSHLDGLNLSVPVNRMPQQYPQHQQGGGYPQGYPPQGHGYPQGYPQGHGYPPQAYPPQGYPPQMHPGHPQPPRPQQYTPMVPSVMGQNNPHLGARKVIPDASAASGFSFLESGNGAKTNPDDAFSFVKDAMTTKK